MTGAAEGKVQINAYVALNGRKIDAVVYIHLKGFAQARVTHLDIESQELNLLPPKSGGFFNIFGTNHGLKIELNNDVVELISSVLRNLVSKTRTWVGGKVDGIYIGFKKNEIVKLERMCTQITAENCHNGA